MKAIFFKAIVKRGAAPLDDDDDAGAPPAAQPGAAAPNPQAADGPDTNPPQDNPGPNGNADDPGAPAPAQAAAPADAGDGNGGDGAGATPAAAGASDTGLAGLLKLLQDVPDDGAGAAPGAGDEPAAEFGPESIGEGDHVAFHAGEFKGAGKVHAVGEDGVTVADGAGRKHQVHWHEIKGKHGDKAAKGKKE